MTAKLVEFERAIYERGEGKARKKSIKLSLGSWTSFQHGLLVEQGSLRIRIKRERIGSAKMTARRENRHPSFTDICRRAGWKLTAAGRRASAVAALWWVAEQMFSPFAEKYGDEPASAFHLCARFQSKACGVLRIFPALNINEGVHFEHGSLRIVLDELKHYTLRPALKALPKRRRKLGAD